MRMKPVQLIPALLIFIISSCGATNPPQLKSLEDPPQAEPFPLESSYESAQTEENLDYWSVEDVDVSEIDSKRKLISFTFDDAPARTLENILAVFAAFNEKNSDCKASGTIFFNGSRFSEESAHLLYSACALGFELGNHTHSHYNLTSLERETLLAEIDEADKLLARIDGKQRHLLRAPFGATNELVKACAKTPIIDWTIDTLDWTGADEKAIYDRVFQGRFSGAIVLMHDGYESTVSALKRLLPDLKTDGYQVVSVSKMLKVHGCNFRNGSVYIRARKQN